MTVRRAVAVVVVFLTGCGSSGDGEDTDIRVFAAASLTDAFEELADDFRDARPDVSVELVFGPSSGLVTQLREGAPADVLATADIAVLGDVLDVLEGEPAVFARNAPALAVPAGNPGGVSSLADLADPSLLVGLCAPEVPCGAVGRRLLSEADVVASVDTEEPDVRALLTKLEAGELDAGIVYRTDVQAAEGAVDAVPVPEADDLVVDYPIAVVTRSEPADAFVDFVLSEDGQAVLTSYGFLPPP